MSEESWFQGAQPCVSLSLSDKKGRPKLVPDLPLTFCVILLIVGHYRSPLSSDGLIRQRCGLHKLQGQRATL